MKRSSLGAPFLCLYEKSCNFVRKIKLMQILKGILPMCKLSYSIILSLFSSTIFQFSHNLTENLTIIKGRENKSNEINKQLPNDNCLQKHHWLFTSTITKTYNCAEISMFYTSKTELNYISC